MIFKGLTFYVKENTMIVNYKNHLVKPNIVDLLIFKYYLGTFKT
jgi:hypothetical protein